MGPSGSGKSTLLHLIAAMDRPTGGEIEVLGSNLRQFSDKQIAHWRNEHIGFIFQSFNLIPVLTALENVELPLKLTNLPKKERLEHAATALKLVGLGDRLGHLPKQLSGGQEQRVAIARAIVTDPDLILADEPTGNLDAAAAEDVLTMLSRLNREFGKTVVMVTHDPHAAKFAATIRHLEKGRLLAGGSAAGRLGPGNLGQELSTRFREFGDGSGRYSSEDYQYLCEALSSTAVVYEAPRIEAP